MTWGNVCQQLKIECAEKFVPMRCQITPMQTNLPQKGIPPESCSIIIAQGLTVFSSVSKLAERVGLIRSLRSLTPFGARFARPNRQAGLSNPVVYFVGSNAGLF
jgi:hypothetical protein